MARNINYILIDYGYSFRDEVCEQIFQGVDDLSNGQLEDIVVRGVESQELKKLLIKTRKDSKRINQAERMLFINSNRKYKKCRNRR